MIWCLHGFLGEGSDWDFLARAGFQIEAPDLFAEPLHRSIEQWADEFAGSVNPDAHLIGYSLGGRLALHALLARPDAFLSAVIVSAGPGIEAADVRTERRKTDEQWAKRFEKESWESVVAAWNRQPLFGGADLPAIREESTFHRGALAHALRAWSPAAHPPLLPRLKNLEVPVLWVAGERDDRYVAEARRAAAVLPRRELWICPRAGHRVPWEQPRLFVERVRSFLSVVSR